MAFVAPGVTLAIPEGVFWVLIAVSLSFLLLLANSNSFSLAVEVLYIYCLCARKELLGDLLLLL